jgi:hypothetical protein
VTRSIFLALAVLAGASAPSAAATITFNSAGTGVESSYSEAGFDVKWYSPDFGPAPVFGYTSAGPDLCATCPSNGTVYAVGLPPAFGPVMTITRTGGGAFTFLGFDAAEVPYIGAPAPSVDIKGLRYDLTDYMTSVLLDGITDGVGGAPDFQTFGGAPGFFDVFTELSFYGGAYNYAIDNIVLEEAEAPAVPEPTTLLLVGAGVAALARRRIRRIRAMTDRSAG